MITRAREFARLAHKDQKRFNGTTPYIVHTERVAAMVSVLQHTTSEMIEAAYLHDTIEDTDVELPDIALQFGDKVGLMVVELTNEFTKEAYPNINRHSRKLREHQRLGGVSIQAKVVKMVDRLDNLRDLQDREIKFIRLYLKESEQMVTMLMKRFSGADGELRLHGTLHHVSQLVKAEIKRNL